tara:strand:- start:196 stop:411 length:216 start_codon:yes stop_codon:yes gene_type:complete
MQIFQLSILKAGQNKEKDMNWLKSRLKERSTLDGVSMVAFCGAVILFGDLAQLFAMAGVVYGLLTIFKKEG